MGKPISTEGIENQTTAALIRKVDGMLPLRYTFDEQRSVYIVLREVVRRLELLEKRVQGAGVNNIRRLR